MKNLVFFIGIMISHIVYANEGESLAKQKACLGCHSTRHIGISYPPAFERIANKYQDNKDQIKYSIRYGKGKMPAHPTLTDAEINLLTEYILTFADLK